MASNAFLSALINVLPNYITDQYFETLARDGVEDAETLEGEQHFTDILNLIKIQYRQVEFRAVKTGSVWGGTDLPAQ